VIEEIDFPDTQQAVFDWAPLCGVETAVAHAETFPSQREAYGPGLAGLIDLGRAQSAMDHQQRLLRRAEFKGRVDRLLASVDLLIAPVTAYAAPSMAFMEKFGEDEALFSGMLRYTCPFDLSGHPTITLPAGFSQRGGPIAFQFIAPMFNEAMLVRAGWAYQQVTDWHRRHPEL
jgi:amidase